MAIKALIVAVSALALLGATASVARAEDKPEVAVTLTDRNLWGPQPVHKSFQWDAGKSRWGLKLDLDQPAGRAAAWQDVQAGAYFKVTPSLSVGGAVALHDQVAPLNQANPQAPPNVPANTPRVRLETAFKF